MTPEEAPFADWTCPGCILRRGNPLLTVDSAQAENLEAALSTSLSSAQPARGTSIEQYGSIRKLMERCRVDREMATHPMESEGSLAVFFEWLLTKGYHRSMPTYKRALWHMLPEEHRSWLERPSIRGASERASDVHGEDRAQADKST